MTVTLQDDAVLKEMLEHGTLKKHTTATGIAEVSPSFNSTGRKKQVCATRKTTLSYCDQIESLSVSTTLCYSAVGYGIYKKKKRHAVQRIELYNIITQ